MMGRMWPVELETQYFECLPVSEIGTNNAGKRKTCHAGHDARGTDGSLCRFGKG